MPDPSFSVQEQLLQSRIHALEATVKLQDREMEAYKEKEDKMLRLVQEVHANFFPLLVY